MGRRDRGLPGSRKDWGKPLAPPLPDFSMALGTIAHQLIGLLVSEYRHLASPTLTAELWAAAGQLATRERFGPRTRAARISAAGAAATYRRYFLPPREWMLAGLEVQIEGRRLDLIWELPDSTIVFDELKLAFGRNRARRGGQTDRQVRAYLACGESTYGERFGGVRLLLLGAPRHSMLIGPGSQLRRLSDTALWFGEERA